MASGDGENGGEGADGSGPVLIGFDGSPAAEHAVREAGKVVRERHALVVVVYKPGLGFELTALPASTIGLPPAPIDIRTAMEIDRAVYEGAQRTARRGADEARAAGFDAEGLAVADEVEVSVADTLLTVAAERDAVAIVVGAHGHGRLPLLGSTSRDVIRRARQPVVVARPPDS